MGSNFRGATIGDYLAGGLDRWSEMLDRQTEEDKNRAREFKSLQEYADVTGIAPKERTTVMDLETLRGMVQARVYQDQRAKERASLDYQNAMALNLQAQTDAAQAANRSSQAMSDFARAYANAGAPTLTGLRDYLANPADMTNLPGMLQFPQLSELAKVRAGLAAAPEAAANPNFDNMLVGLSRLAGLNGRTGGGYELVQDPVSGKRFFLYGNSALPSGEDLAVTQQAGTETRTVGGHDQYWSGRQWMNFPEDRSLPTPIVESIRSLQTQRALLVLRRDKLAAQVKAEPGNVKRGPDWYPSWAPWGQKAYKDQLAELEKQIAGIDDEINVLSSGGRTAITTSGPAATNAPPLAQPSMWDRYQAFKQTGGK